MRNLRRIGNQAFNRGIDGKVLAKEIKSLNEKLGSVPSNIMGTVLHLEDSSVERPEFSVVMWIGSVEPVNAQNNDLWINL